MILLYLFPNGEVNPLDYNSKIHTTGCHQLQTDTLLSGFNCSSSYEVSAPQQWTYGWTDEQGESSIPLVNFVAGGIKIT